ncbi:hypothetical protein AIOL_002738 [Candidatus Rhodobacter oscarellae]|uniref:DUF4177 domain-containing protein n=1 Tax=Candidatus Rhodobacter oscarellae TaxID=1675527 RepID=A0A0J9E4Q5_9RHOB|nr:DUF4177 domain-containing protein [Candidatus Rhodobacter lobularis]KMW57770.1 hypothetical protein AIOL_002738 [Candidatus Rhodobacter lobularis]
MARYEYKVVPAPRKPGKIKGVKGTDNRFAHELSALMNEYGADGWEYQRTDTLPCEERSGLTGRTTTFQNMLVFRRALDEGHAPQAVVETAVAAAPEPITDPTPAPMTPATERATIPTFRSAAMGAAPAVSAPSRAAEGSAPAVTPTRAQDIAAQ